MPEVLFYPQRCFPPSASTHMFDRIALNPGRNLLSEEVIAQLQSHPSYPKYETWKAIEVVRNAPTEIELGVATPTSSLSELSVEDAEKLVEFSRDVSELEGWLAVEKRTTLRRAINKRITAIKGGNE